MIPYTYYEKDSNQYLLVMLHGFMSDPTEDGRFSDLASSLLDKGWNSVILQYEGKLQNYSQFTIEQGIRSIEEVIENLKIDYSNVALLGYSLGGTLSAILIQRHPEIHLFISYAGYIKPDNRIFGGTDLIKIVTSKQEPVIVNKLFDERVPVTKQFCKELLEFNPGSCFTNYRGKIVLINGIYDQFVSQEDTYGCLTVRCKEKTTLLQLPTDHSFGGWLGHPFYDKQLSDFVVSFTQMCLQKFITNRR